MEHSIVTFKNEQTGEEIKITLNYNKENSNLDYNVEMSDSYKKDSPMDFNGFLANMFLNSLQIKDN